MTDNQAVDETVEEERGWDPLFSWILAAVLIGLLLGLVAWGVMRDDTPPAVTTTSCATCAIQTLPGIDVNVDNQVDIVVEVNGGDATAEASAVADTGDGVDISVAVSPPSTVVSCGCATTTTPEGGGGTTTTTTSPSTTTTVAPPTTTTMLPPTTTVPPPTTTTTITVPPTTTTTTAPPVNHNPTISVNPEFAEKWAGTNGEACFTFTANASDPDGDSLTISWSTGGSGSSTTVCRGVGNAWRISATVYDGRGGSASDGSTFNVLDRPGG